MNKVTAHRAKALRERGAATQELRSIDATSVAAVSFRKAITEKVMVWGCVLASSIHHKAVKFLLHHCQIALKQSERGCISIYMWRRIVRRQNELFGAVHVHTYTHCVVRAHCFCKTKLSGSVCLLYSSPFILLVMLMSAL